MRSAALPLLALCFGVMALWNLGHQLADGPPPVDTWWHRALLDAVFAVTLASLEKNR